MLLAIGSTSLICLTHPRSRPLGLFYDPSTSAVAALMIQRRADVFEGFDIYSIHNMHEVLNDKAFALGNGQLVPLSTSKSEKLGLKRSKKRRSKAATLDWRPSYLRRWTGLLLLLLLISITFGLVALYVVSKRSGLHEAAFVDTLSLGRFPFTIAPYSIVPTLVAVFVKLWWGTIDSASRRLTPFLSMVTSPQPAKSTTTSYVTTPIAWITFIAVKRRHWILAMVTFGAIGAEVLQVTMSGLWSRQLSSSKHTVNLQQRYVVRSVPHTFVDDEESHAGAIRKRFGDLSNLSSMVRYPPGVKITGAFPQLICLLLPLLEQKM